MTNHTHYKQFAATNRTSKALVQMVDYIESKIKNGEHFLHSSYLRAWSDNVTNSSKFYGLQWDVLTKFEELGLIVRCDIVNDNGTYRNYDIV